MTQQRNNPADKLWKSPAARDGRVEAPPPPGVSRRDFLAVAGFTVSAAAVSGCHRAPEQKALPFANQPPGARPGRMRQFASTCLACPAACGLLIGVRDGRPLKMEGLPEHPLSHGGLCAVGQAQTLALYDSQRLTGPTADGNASTWEEVDKAIAAALKRVEQDGGAVRVVTPTVVSPTLQQSIDRFLKRFSDAEHVVFDPCSASAILDAHQATHGKRLLPRYRFERAKVVVSLEADFLGAWLAPVEHTAGWKQQRRLPARAAEAHAAHGHDEDQGHDEQHGRDEQQGRDEQHHEDKTPASDAKADSPAEPAELSYHVQLEARMTLTGSNADERIRLHPAQAAALLRHLHGRIAKLAGVENSGVVSGDPPVAEDQITTWAKRLWKHKGESLVVCGHNDVAAQMLVNHINELLGNYGQTVDIEHPSRQRQGNDAAAARLADELAGGKVAALIAAGVDLTYYLPQAADSISEVKLAISLNERIDDFGSRARYICPDHHPLESWLDAEPVAGLYSLCQPTIDPLGGTRSAIESFSKWSGGDQSAYALIRQYWEEDIFPRRQDESDFSRFWDRAVHDGFVKVDAAAEETDFQPQLPEADAAETTDGLTVVIHPAQTVPDSRHAHNPWLQELPDPVTKVTWDNCLTISPALAREEGLADNDVVKLTVGDAEPIELPVFVQPGQHDDVLAVSLGYGVPGTERFATVGPQWLEAGPTVGVNGRVGVAVSSLLNVADDGMHNLRGGARISKTGRRHILATTQLHDAIEVPPEVAPPGSGDRMALIQETTLAEFNENPSPPARRMDIISTANSGRKITPTTGIVGGWRSTCPPAPAAPPAWSPVRRRTTCRWSAATKSAATGRCIGYASTVITRAMRTNPMSPISR